MFNFKLTKMKSITYGLIWTLFIFAICAFRCKTFDPLIWGWGTRTFFMIYLGTGALILLGFNKQIFRELTSRIIIYITSYVVIMTILLWIYIYH